MTAITKFGQEVRIEVFDENGVLVFNTAGLRVDFDVRIVPDYNRAKFTVYNLSPKTIREISNGERYIRLYTRLHGGREQILNYDFYLNNAVTVKQVPDSLTELYCIGTTRKNFTSKTVNIKVDTPTLKRYCEALAREAKVDIEFIYEGFPKDIENYKPIKPTAVWSGEVLEALKKLGQAYSFTVNEETGSTLKLKYLPLAENVNQTDTGDSTVYKLQTKHMRSNPRIGVAQLDIESNLDLNIRAGTILDTSELITASAGDTFEYLTQINNAIVSPTSGNSRFSVLSVQHKGSNYTGSWSTIAMAYKPTAGTKTSDCIKE